MSGKAFVFNVLAAAAGTVLAGYLMAKMNKAA